MIYNHEKELSDFLGNINRLKENGFNPIAVSHIRDEDVYVFDTEDESLEAYYCFEKDSDDNYIGDITGWWYSKDEFHEEVRKYESQNYTKVLTYWL